MKRTLDGLGDQPLEGLRAFVRVDFNVPLHEGRVTDSTRIEAALPTIAWLRARGCRVVLASHLGRPGGRPDPALSLRHVVADVERLLGTPVAFVAEPWGDEAVQASRRARRGDVLLLENTRFHPGEKANDPGLAEALARLGDFYVNDAFGSAHRAHASTAGVPARLKPAVAGFLMAKELQYLSEALADPARPYVAVLGGAKISGKIDVIESLLPRVDRILIGGAMACTFFAAMDLEVGRSLIEADRVEMARALLAGAGDRIVLPSSVVVAPALDRAAERRAVPRDEIPPDAAVFDIDQAAAASFAEALRPARTIVWNGPMGVFETPPFDEGTVAVATTLAELTACGATTVVGGGDSGAALARAGLTDRVSHVSTGGGAALELLEGKQLPGVAALDDA